VPKTQKTHTQLMVDQHMDQCAGEFDEHAHTLCRMLHVLGFKGSVTLAIEVNPLDQLVGAPRCKKRYDIATGKSLSQEPT
jgi:hypothetical protein